MTDTMAGTAAYPVVFDPTTECWHIRGEVHDVRIEIRPDYCDRARYVAHIDPIHPADHRYTIEPTDGWPRYYMDPVRMLAEIREWLAWREYGPRPGWTHPAMAGVTNRVRLDRVIRG